MSTLATFLRYLLHLSFFLIVPIALSAQPVERVEAVTTNASVQPQHLRQPSSVLFTKNNGQIVDTDGHLRPEILYKAESNGVELYFTRTGVSYVFSRLEGDARQLGRCHSHDGDDHDHNHDHHAAERPRLHLYRMDLELVGANAEATVLAEDAADEYLNYYLAHCPDGITNVPTYRKLIYKEVYPNIDLVIYAMGSGTKADFVVRPGGSVDDIRLRYTAANRTKVERDGSLRVVTPLGFLHEGKPYTYQDVYAGVGRNVVTSSYRLTDGVVGFSVGNYDRAKNLVIDPEQIWATFYGGVRTENMNGGDPTEVDRSSNVLITGYTLSSPFPTTPGAYQETFQGGTSFGDVFLVKFNQRGIRQWATYFGGSRDEIGHGVSSDKNGNVFITGHTEGAVPTTAGALRSGSANLQGSGIPWGRDAFVAKFSPAGSLLWSTHIGGNGWDDGYGFAVDSNDNVAVLVTTQNDGLATSPAYQTTRKGGYEILLIKLDKDGQRLWATYYGGTGTEYGYAAASDIDDNIVFTGWTTGGTAPNAFPVTNGSTYKGNTDAFVVKFNSSGSLLWSTYYGGTGKENEGGFGLLGGAVGFCGITTDGDKNVLITGTTTSSDLPTSDEFQPRYGGGVSDAFIVKYDPDGVRQWATYVGGSGRDIGVGVAASPIGNVLATGITNSTSFPVTSPPDEKAFQSTYQGGDHDAFIVKLTARGQQSWGTYYGGSQDDQGHGISFDPHGFIIIAGHTQSNSAVPFVRPRSASEPAQQPFYAGMTDAFISVFCDPVPPTIDSSGPTTFCHDQSLTLSFDATGYTKIEWYRNADAVPFSTLASVTLTESGDYYLRVESPGGCPATSPKITVKKLDRPNPVLAPPPLLCAGDSVELNTTGGPYSTYRWKRDGVVIPGAASARLTVKQGGTYRVIVTDRWGCPDSAQQTVTEHPRPTALNVFPADTVEICEGLSTTLAANGGVGGNIEWSNGSTGSSLVVTTQGTYFAKSVSPGSGCSTTSNSVYVKVNRKPAIRVVNLLPTEFCEGDSTVLVADPNNLDKYEWSTGETSKQITVKRSGTFTLTVTDTKGCINQAQISVTMSERPKPKINPPGPHVLCEGEEILLNVEGSGFQKVIWSNGAIGSSLRVTKSGTYYAMVSNATNCEAFSDTVTVTVNPKPNVLISGSLEVCVNSSETYSIPAVPGLIYEWSVTGAGASIASGGSTNSITVNWGPAGNGTVTVIATDPATTCKATSTVNVVVGSALVPNITGNRSSRLCPGDSITLDAGGGYASYQWSNNATTRTITVKDPGSYTVSVENTSGCGGTSKPYTVTIVDGPKPTIVASRSTTLCPGDTVYLTTSQPYEDYRWSGGQTIDRIAVWTSGTYTLSVVDSNGCRGTSEPIEVVVAAPPAPVITGPGSVCINSTKTYAVVNIAGDSYTWSVAGGQPTTGLNSNTITIEWPTAGEYWIELRQRSGVTSCEATVRYKVVVGTSLQPTVTADKSTLICENAEITLDAGDGYAAYRWDDGSTGRFITVRTPRTYVVTVTDAGGCSGTGEITVTQKPPLDPKIVPDGRPGLCAGDSLRLEATSGFKHYRWSTGDTTPSIFVKQAGSYTVTVHDLDSCVGVSAKVDVVVFPQLSTPLIVAVGDTLVAVIDTVDGPKPALYQWWLEGVAISGGTARSYYTQVVGTYTVTVVDSNGCSATSAPFTTVSAASATVQLPELEAAPGERVSIPVALVASENLDRNKVQKFVGELRFDKNLLIPVDPRFRTRVEGDQRVVMIEGDRPTTMSEGELLRVEFIAALGEKMSTPLEFLVFNWVDGTSVPVRMIAGRFTLTDICETGGRRLVDASGNAAIKSVRPNPAHAVSEIEYEVNEHGRTQLVIVDLLGQPVATLVNGDLQPGRYLVQFDASKLASGTYFCVLQTPTLRLHQLIQVEK